MRLIYHDQFVGGMKGERCIGFLNDISQANTSNQIAMIFDNAPCHRHALQPPQVDEVNINVNQIVLF